MDDCSTCAVRCDTDTRPSSLDFSSARRAVIDESTAMRSGAIGGGFHVRPMRLAPREVHQGHAHWVDHVSNIVSGAVDIEWEDPQTGARGVLEVRTRTKVLIKAAVWHRFVALDEPVEWECWFARPQNEQPLIPYHAERIDG